MDILGSIGKLYTFILLVILFLGSGLAVWAGINAIMNKKDDIKQNTDKLKENLSSKLQGIKNNNIIGGINMKNNSFIKLAVFSFVGIIISAAILTALPNYSNSNMNNMNSQYNATSMNMQGNMYGQSNMQGMSSYNTQGTMSSNADLYSIQQQLSYMQQQIYQIQNQMNSSMNSSGSSMNNNSNMNSNTNSSTTNSNSNSSGSGSSMSSMPMM